MPELFKALDSVIIVQLSDPYRMELLTIAGEIPKISLAITG